MAKKKIMKRPPARRKPTVNPDSILELVKHCGGFAQAAKRMGESGVVNPSSGKPYSKHTIKRIASSSSGWAGYQKSIDKGITTFGDRVDALLEEVRHGDEKAEA